MRREEKVLRWLAARARLRGARISGVIAAIVAVAIMAPAGAGAFTKTYVTPGSSTFVVPPNVKSIAVEVFGAAGGASGDGKAGGLGAKVQVTELPVVANETLSVVVGGRGGNGVNGNPLEVCDWGAGGLNGGGEAGECDGEGAAAGGGGGASELRRGSSRLVVAGGGGGAGANGTGGAGGAGGQSGVAGTSGAAGGGGGGGGGTPTTGGKGGAGQGGGQAGKVGTAAVGGEGGFWSDASGGGGGGGLFGGGGGGGSQNFSGGGGGGGSSTGPAGTVYTTGSQPGNGKVVIIFFFEPSITVAASGGVTIGGAVHATATLTGAQEPEGTIEFSLYGPDDQTCSGTPVFTGSSSVTTTGTTYESGPFTPTTVGTYRWVASYSGDTSNKGTDSSCAEESAKVTVAGAEPSVAVAASPGVELGGAVDATATLAGAHEPTGTISFSLYGPEDPTCSGTPTFTGSSSVTTTETTYGSGPFTPTAVGTYHWVVRYSGDVNNGAAINPCADPAAAVTVTAPQAPPTIPTTDPVPATSPAPVTNSAPAPSTPAVPQPVPSIQVLHSPNTPHAPDPKGGPRWTFVFAGTPGVTYYCQIDKGPFKACSPPTVYRNLTKGRHVFKVKSVDAAGLESTVETVSFQVGRKRQGK